jgi:predicted DNA-binding transcriptional regulator AlpA
MNRQELANLLGVHVETVKRREKTDSWPRPVRITSKVVLYDRTDVERFLQEANKAMILIELAIGIAVLCLGVYAVLAIITKLDAHFKIGEKIRKWFE